MAEKKEKKAKTTEIAEQKLERVRSQAEEQLSLIHI